MTTDPQETNPSLDPALAAIAPTTLLEDGEGILTGGGGGFTWHYTDFLLTGPMGETSVAHYWKDESTGEPMDVETSRLLLENREDGFSRLMQMAIEIDFFNIRLAPPATSIFRHTAVAHPVHGTNVVVWSKVASPAPPIDLVRFDLEIRRFLSLGFLEEHGY